MRVLAEKVISEFLSIARTDLKVIKRIRWFPRASKSHRAISGIDDWTCRQNRRWRSSDIGIEIETRQDLFGETRSEDRS